jgi:single-strand DNA-binding protein
LASSHSGHTVALLAYVTRGHPLASCPNYKGRNGVTQNKVHLIGYLGKNPEYKSVKTTDRKYAVLSLATQRSWKGADEEWHSKTEWHRVIAWNGLSEYAAAKLPKGDHIYVEGTLVSST